MERQCEDFFYEVVILLWTGLDLGRNFNWWTFLRENLIDLEITEELFCAVWFVNCLLTVHFRGEEDFGPLQILICTQWEISTGCCKPFGFIFAGERRVLREGCIRPVIRACCNVKERRWVCVYVCAFQGGLTSLVYFFVSGRSNGVRAEKPCI